MSRYQVFVSAFIISIIAFVIFITAHVYGIFNMIRSAETYAGSPADPFQMFSTIFSPVWIISMLLLMATGLLYRVLGIIFTANNTKMESGEKALWIIGFVIFGFITAIVFMALRNSKNLTGDVQSEPYKSAENQI
jgi:hypothetical protein